MNWNIMQYGNGVGECYCRYVSCIEWNCRHSVVQALISIQALVHLPLCKTLLVYFCVYEILKIPILLPRIAYLQKQVLWHLLQFLLPHVVFLSSSYFSFCVQLFHIILPYSRTGRINDIYIVSSVFLESLNLSFLIILILVHALSFYI